MTGVMRECLRVLKPGAHALVWALPRTSHWTATAIEDAGFEVRDVITHHFGTGFPKSLDVSKSLDKAAGAARTVVGIRKRNGGPAGMTAAAGWHAGPMAEDDATEAVTAPATEAARQWAGWGTALKPASEHWILARKPLIGTVAANVLEHGTGGLNIDASRIPSGADHAEKCASVVGLSSNRNGMAYGEWTGERTDSYSPAGRFPANVVFTHNHDCPDGGPCTDGCPVGELDGQSISGGMHGAGAARNKAVNDDGTDMLAFSGAHDMRRLGDSGGASRFFYCAKPSASEKHPERQKNTHPTVKSVALMTYLARLVTPPGGLVLDPFAGSGTTGIAAALGGWRFVGWEQDPESAAIATARLREATAQGILFASPVEVAS
jgi:site-specific DNA-methyltransferase (adenine-specific)